MRRAAWLAGSALLIAACTTVTPVPSEAPPPAASATPARSESGQMPQPSAVATAPASATAPRPESPSQSVDPAQVLERFARVTDDGQAPFHLRAHRLIDDGAMTMEGAARGADFAGELRLEFFDLDETIDLVIVDGAIWVLDPARGWRKAPDELDFVQPINPLAGGVGSLEHLRSLPRGAQTVHILRSTEWTGPEFSGAMRNLRIASSVLDVYVTDAGVPLDGHIDYVAVGRAFGIDDNFLAVRINYTFSEMGEPVTIEEPVEGVPGVPG